MRPTGRRAGGPAGGWAVGWLVALLLSLLVPGYLPGQAVPARADLAVQAPLATAVGQIGLTVSDMDRSVAFYTRVLHFRMVADTEVAGGDYERLQGLFGLRMRVTRLRLGGEELELTEYLAPRGRPAPVDARSNDGWFQHVAIIVRDMDRAYRWLRQNRVEHASSGPQRLPDWNPNAGGIEAFYFRDPDGHPLEILAFPAGKGDPRWHRATDSLFLGIDHTAIVVRDTEASLAFYRDVLGLRVAGESENYGTEQEHLNNVFGARLRITGLRAARGPGIEFLEYLAPRDGRPMPPDERASDLIHWQTGMAVRDMGEAWRALRAARARFVSPGPVMVAGELGFRTGLLVRDPDGHVVRLTQ
ncbi:MAG: VOC family protein [Gemmatimonadales bacterium]